MPTETGSGAAEAPSGRQRALADAAERFRRLDLRNTWQVAAGSVLVPLGIAIVLLAWYGSAHSPYVQGQIPYLVSGSFIGLGLMVVGGLLYWAHWLYRIYDQADLHQTEQAQRDRQLFDLLEALLARDLPGASRAGPAARRAVAGSGPEMNGPGLNGPVTNGLVVTASGSNVHRPECPIVARHRSGVRSLSVAELEGRTPCRICQPDLG